MDNTFIQWVAGINSDWYAGIIATAALIISIQSNWTARQSVKESSKQNYLVLHQRYVDAYRTFHDDFDAWYGVSEKADAMLVGKVSAACDIIKILFPSEIGVEMEKLFGKVLQLHGIELAHNFQTKEFEKNLANGDRYSQAAVKNRREVAEVSAELVRMNKFCRKLIEEEISLHKKLTRKKFMGLL